MKKVLCFFLAVVALQAQSQDLSTLESKRVHLPNGWSLTPAGKSLPLGDLPLNVAISNLRHFAAVTNNGQSTQTIQLFDANTDQQLDEVVIRRSWGGLVFSDDEKHLYASGGNDNWILDYKIRRNKLEPYDTFKLGPRYPKAEISPTGIAIDDRHHLLYVVTKEDNSLYVIDLYDHKTIQQLPLGSEGYTCMLSPDKTELYITLWGADKVLVYDTKKNVFTESIAVGDNPNDMCLSKNGRYLYVANANDNNVTVIDIKARKVVETLNAALYPTKLSGSTSKWCSAERR